MKVLCLGDMHLPYPDMALLKQAHEFNKSYKADKVVCVGDVTDQKGWSDYIGDTDDPGPDEEWDLVVSAAKKVERLFPKLEIVPGNHDLRYFKKANGARIPKQLIKTLKEALPIPGWTWHIDSELELDNVLYIHGDEEQGAVEAKAKLLGQSVVQGHSHQGRIVYVTTRIKHKRIFGMDLGCVADVTSTAFRYAKRNIRKSWVGYGIVNEGRSPHLFPKR